MRLTLLHTNDVHGEVDGLARIATLVERIRAETPHRVLYVDCGDIEETTSRLSNLAKGVAMHRLLSAAGCEAAAVGNAVWLRYGPRAVSDEAAAATYPLLCANLKPFEHVRDSLLIDGIGVVGITDPFPSFRAQPTSGSTTSRSSRRCGGSRGSSARTAPSSSSCSRTWGSTRSTCRRPTTCWRASSPATST